MAALSCQSLNYKRYGADWLFVKCRSCLNCGITRSTKIIKYFQYALGALLWLNGKHRRPLPNSAGVQIWVYTQLSLVKNSICRIWILILYSVFGAGVLKGLNYVRLFSFLHLSVSTYSADLKAYTSKVMSCKSDLWLCLFRRFTKYSVFKRTCSNYTPTNFNLFLSVN